MADVLVTGKPVALKYGLVSINSGFLRGMVAACFGLLGFPGVYKILHS